MSSACFPDGEQYTEIESRCKRFYDEYLTKCEHASFVLVVTHGITCRVLINALLSENAAYVKYIDWVDNTAITEIEIDGTMNKKISSGSMENGYKHPCSLHWEALFCHHENRGMRQVRAN